MSTHEISEIEKGKQPLISMIDKRPRLPERSIVSGLVKHGSRPGVPAGIAGDVSSEAGDERGSPAIETVVELSSHEVHGTYNEPKTLSMDGRGLNGGMVEHGSHRVAQAENLHQRASGVQTDGPKLARERTGGYERAQISERHRPTRTEFWTVQESRARRVEFWKVKSKKATGGMSSSSMVSRIEQHVRLKKRGEHDVSRDDHVTLVSNGEYVGPTRPVMLDPILLGDLRSIWTMRTQPMLHCLIRYYFVRWAAIWAMAAQINNKLGILWRLGLCCRLGRLGRLVGSNN